jgi:ribosomal protein S18 acetylase RimI-like enzyme
MSIIYTESLTVEAYNGLRKSVNWSAIEEPLAKKGLEHTAFVISANDEGVPVGMARVITDYGYIVYIADVIVRPDYQGMGIGRALMSNVMAYIDENISPGQGKFINLMAAPDKEGFYEKFGFIKRPNDTLGCGMTQWVQKATLA